MYSYIFEYICLYSFIFVYIRLYVFIFVFINFQAIRLTYGESCNKLRHQMVDFLVDDDSPLAIDLDSRRVSWPRRDHIRIDFVGTCLGHSLNVHVLNPARDNCNLSTTYCNKVSFA